MIPGPALSTVPVASAYLYPDSIAPDYTVDYEMGGVGIQDPSEGLQVKVWTARLAIDRVTNVGVVTVEADDVAPVELFTRTNITEISLAFDQNMNPFIAFVDAGDAWFWWYDAVLAEQVFTQLPAGTTSPKCCLDDKRSGQVSASDIILGYVRSGALYFRAQRDRYTIEYLLDASVTGNLLEVGMNEGNRLQFTLGTFG